MTNDAPSESIETLDGENYQIIWLLSVEGPETDTVEPVLAGSRPAAWVCPGMYRETGEPILMQQLLLLWSSCASFSMKNIGCPLRGF